MEGSHGGLIAGLRPQRADRARLPAPRPAVPSRGRARGPVEVQGCPPCYGLVPGQQRQAEQQDPPEQQGRQAVRPFAYGRVDRVPSAQCLTGHSGRPRRNGRSWRMAGLHWPLTDCRAAAQRQRNGRGVRGRDPTSPGRRRLHGLPCGTRGASGSEESPIQWGLRARRAAVQAFGAGPAAPGWAGNGCRRAEPAASAHPSPIPIAERGPYSGGRRAK